MARNTASADDASHRNPAADLDTIVVDPDDVIEAMRRNDRDRDEQRSHVLRVTPPLEGEQTATPYVDEAHAHYPQLSQKPLHLTPEAFIVGDGAGNRHPDWCNEWSYPHYGQEQHRFRDEIDAWDDGEVRPLTDEEEDEWEEWWGTVVEMWEDCIRHALKNTKELMLTGLHPDTDDTTVAVRVE